MNKAGKNIRNALATSTWCQGEMHVYREQHMDRLYTTRLLWNHAASEPAASGMKASRMKKDSRLGKDVQPAINSSRSQPGCLSL